MEKYEDEYELERVKVELNMAVDELLKLRAENKRWQEILRSPRPRGVLPWNGHNYRCPKCGSHDALFWNFKIICSPCHYGGQDIEAIDCRIEEIDRLRDAAVGYAEAAEYWRMKYHRERIFTTTCCRRSLSGQLLHKLLETREPVTRHLIKHLLHDVMDGSRFQSYLDDYIALLEMIRASRVAWGENGLFMPNAYHPACDDCKLDSCDGCALVKQGIMSCGTCAENCKHAYDPHDGCELIKDCWKPRRVGRRRPEGG